MSSQSRLEIQGQAPFKQSGVYEAQITVTDSKPSDDDIRSKKFSSLWRGNFHLRVKDGFFSETLGSTTNPLPSSIANLDRIWIVVTDLFSSLHTVFDIPLTNSSSTSKTKSETKPPTKPNIDNQKPTRSSKTNVVRYASTTGQSGDKGPPGQSGDPPGQSGDKGPPGQSGDKGPPGPPPGQQGPIGLKGPEGPPGQSGDKGASGDKGSQGDKGLSGDKGLTGDKGVFGDKGDKGDKGITGPPGDKGEKGPTGPIGDKGLSGLRGPPW